MGMLDMDSCPCADSGELSMPKQWFNPVTWVGNCFFGDTGINEAEEHGTYMEQSLDAFGNHTHRLVRSNNPEPVAITEGLHNRGSAIRPEQQNPKDVNILVIGAYGTGVFEWVKAFIGYGTYGSAGSVGKNIPLLIRHLAARTAETEESAGKVARTFRFSYWNYNVTLTACPDVGDYSQPESPMFDKVLEDISNIPLLHGILVLLNPASNDLPGQAPDGRFPTRIRFFLHEVFLHLHHDAMRNVMFLFTDTELPRTGRMAPFWQLYYYFHLSFEMMRENMFHIDGGILFTEAACRASIHDNIQWEICAKRCRNSIKDTVRLIIHVAHFDPTKTTRTTLLKDARYIIADLGHMVEGWASDRDDMEKQLARQTTALSEHNKAQANLPSWQIGFSPPVFQSTVPELLEKLDQLDRELKLLHHWQMSSGSNNQQFFETTT